MSNSFGIEKPALFSLFRFFSFVFANVLLKVTRNIAESHKKMINSIIMKNIPKLIKENVENIF